MTQTAMTPALLEFLKWIAASERSYDEAMEAWQTSCPRSSVWEDAMIAGLTILRRTDNGTIVELTTDGRRTLASAAC